MATYSEAHAVGWISFDVEVTEEELLEAIATWWDDDATPDEILAELVSGKISDLQGAMSVDGVSIDWQGAVDEAETSVEDDFGIDPDTLKIAGNKRTALLERIV